MMRNTHHFPQLRELDVYNIAIRAPYGQYALQFLI